MQRLFGNGCGPAHSLIAEKTDLIDGYNSVCRLSK